jgi:zinc protease
MNYGDYSYIEWYEGGGNNMLPLPGFPRNSNYFSIWLRPVQTAEGLKSQYPELKDLTVGHAHFALRMAIRELDQLIKKGMTEADFNLTRDFLRSYMKLYIQTPGKQLGFLMDSRFYNRKDYIAEMDELLAGLTLEDVNNAITKYWQTNSMYVCIVTDDSEAEALKVSLFENTPSPMFYSDALRSTLPPSILAEDEEVSVFPLNVTNVEIREASEMFRN